MHQIIEQCVAILKAGGTILYPTDTIWGIGCDATQPEAVEKIYRIKQRDHSKSMLILMANCPLCKPTDQPTTWIVPANQLHITLAPNLIALDGTIGVRVPQHDFCQQLLSALGNPIVSTSANFSRQPSPQRYEDIAETLKQEIDYCVPNLPQFASGKTQGSRIIKLLPDGSEIVVRP